MAASGACTYVTGCCGPCRNALARLLLLLFSEEWADAREHKTRVRLPCTPFRDCASWAKNRNSSPAATIVRPLLLVSAQTVLDKVGLHDRMHTPSCLWLIVFVRYLSFKDSAQLQTLGVFRKSNPWQRRMCTGRAEFTYLRVTMYGYLSAGQVNLLRITSSPTAQCRLLKVESGPLSQVIPD